MSSARGDARSTAAALASGMTSCSLPVSTHSGGPATSAASSPSIAASSAREAEGSRCFGAFACSVHTSPSRVDGDDAGGHLERDAIAGVQQVAHHVRRAQRRMPGEGHLERGREDAHARRRERGRQHERGLGEVELQCQRLHGRRVELAGVLEDAQRVAAEGALGEDVDDAIAQVHPAASTCATSVRAASRNAGASMPPGATASARSTAGKLPRIERVYMGS